MSMFPAIHPMLSWSFPQEPPRVDGKKVPIHVPYKHRCQWGSEIQLVGMDPHYSNRGTICFHIDWTISSPYFYLRCWALIWYYSTRLLTPVVSEPSTEVSSVAWLLIALSYKRFRVPAIHPIYSDPILLKPLIKGSSFPDWVEMQSYSIWTWYYGTTDAFHEIQSSSS